MFYLRLTLDLVSNLMEHNVGGGMGEVIGSTYRVPLGEEFESPEPLMVTPGFTYGSNSSTLIPSLKTSIQHSLRRCLGQRSLLDLLSIIPT